MMAVDVSGSMAERDFDWNGSKISRLQAVQRVFRLFVAGGDEGAHFEGRPADLIGLVPFGTRPDAGCPLTLSHSALLRLLDAEQPRGSAGEGETNLSDALALGLHRLKSAGPRRRVLILLTDGEHNQFTPPSGWTPRQAAQIAGSLGIPVYTIDAGLGESTAERRKQAAETLEQIADISKGKYFGAGDTRALLGACQAIDRLERDKIRSFRYRRHHEGYPWFALASLLLFGAALGLDMTLWRRLP
jgi:Ca-activated chloride channel family protein